MGRLFGNAGFRAIAVLAIALCVAISGCGNRNTGGRGSQSSGNAALTILSGSENKTLEPIIDRFAQQKGVAIKMEYLGSVDIMLRLQNGDSNFDAVWPANSLWVQLGDKQKHVKYQQSIMRSPVVMGVKKSVAARLGWIGKNVKVNDILKAAESGKLRFMMTSASQSNSGAAAYLGYLYAFAGSPDVLTSKHLANPNVRSKIKRILGAVNRSSGSSGWLKDLFIQKYDSFDAMVNYESLIIETNQQLASQGREPLYAIYPVDGLAIADSPLGYVDRGDRSKESLFKELQAYLLSKDVQNEILKLGRRAGLLGMDVSGVDRAVFNPEWGIDVDEVITPIRYPSPEVLSQALSLYQTAFRKPSMTIYCLDFSGSMAGEGEQELKEAMRTLLDQNTAGKYLLQSTPGDVTVVIPFSDAPHGMWVAKGNSQKELSSILQKIERYSPDGSTDIYSPIMQGMGFLKSKGNLHDYFPAIILMTDGNSNYGKGYNDLENYIRTVGVKADVPVFAIMFGSASEDQLKRIANFTSGTIFDGRTNLVDAFRKAKGYN